VDLVKIDVEGFELDVLQGCTETVKEFCPVFCAEFNSYAIACNRNMSPLAFGRYAMKNFGGFLVERDGTHLLVNDEQGLRDFVYSNMAARQCIDDIAFGRGILEDARFIN
jgi:hypothetical protein